jgi:hypothetical protein
MVEKFDINNIMDNIKSMISPEGETPTVDPDDAIGVKITQVSVIAQELTKEQTESAKKLATMNALLNELYKDIEALRAQHSEEA